jgi:CubicO group peptidase (beta-lactamase class C family)
MTHTAGFTYDFFNHRPVSRHYQKVKPKGTDSVDELIKRMAKLPLMYHPGEAWEYSVSVDIQGALIERLD